MSCESLVQALLIVFGFLGLGAIIAIFLEKFKALDTLPLIGFVVVILLYAWGIEWVLQRI
jgi:hypothetical protein